MSRIASVLALILTLMGCGQRTPAKAPEIAAGPPRLLILSSLIGYVEPCGCTLDLLRGGVDRVATRVAEERAKGPTAVLVLGSTFFEGEAPAHLQAQEQAKADLLARTLKHIGVDAFVPGLHDHTYGSHRLSALLKAANLKDLSGDHKLLNLGPLRVGIFALSDHGGVEQSTLQATTTEQAAALREAGAHVVVALGAVPRRALRRLAQKTDAVDLWVLGRQPHPEQLASPAGSGHLIEAGDRGQNLGRVLLINARAPGPLRDPVGHQTRTERSLKNQLKMKQRMALMMPSPMLTTSITTIKKKLAALSDAPAPDLTKKHFEYRLLPIEKIDVQEPTIAGWIATYNAQLKTINLAAAGQIAPVPPGGRAYSGAEECADCHPEAVAVHTPTAHARAWKTLVDAGKTFDAGCVSCHVVGWQKPSGTVLGQTKGLEGVQCEACHGPGSRHNETTSEADIDLRVPKTVCVGCHNHHHSPKFDYDTYLPKILGPGHGQPSKP